MAQSPLLVLPGMGSRFLSREVHHLVTPSSDEKEECLKTALGVLLTGGSSLTPQVSKGILFKGGE